MKRDIHLIKRKIQKIREMGKEKLIYLSTASDGLTSLIATNELARNGYLRDGLFVGIATATNAMPTGYIKDFNKYLQLDA